MTTDRQHALAGGILYLVTFVTSIPALALKTPFLQQGSGPTAAVWGTILEVLLALACVGTAVTLYPVTRRHGETLALGFVASRLLEAGLILVGVVTVLSLVRLDAAGTTTPAVRFALVALHDQTFLLGPAVMAAVNALMLGTVLFRARLVPRVIPAIGLVGAPLLLASSAGVMLGAWTQVSALGALSALPIAVWEFSLGVWLVVRGWTPRPTSDEEQGPAGYAGPHGRHRTPSAVDA